MSLDVPRRHCADRPGRNIAGCMSKTGGIFFSFLLHSDCQEFLESRYQIHVAVTSMGTLGWLDYGTCSTVSSMGDKGDG